MAKVDDYVRKQALKRLRTYAEVLEANSANYYKLDSIKKEGLVSTTVLDQVGEMDIDEMLTHSDESVRKLAKMMLEKISL